MNREIKPLTISRNRFGAWRALYKVNKKGGNTSVRINKVLWGCTQNEAEKEVQKYYEWR